MTQKLSEVILSSDNCQRSRAWCFTCNNWNEDDCFRILSIKEKCEYFIMGYEGEGKTPHLQGYMYFKSQRTFQSLVKKLTHRFHLEVARGTPAQNKEYCSKEGKVVESGTIPKQGERKDIKSFVEDVKSGMSNRELFDAHPECMVKYRKAKEDIINAYNAELKRERPIVKVIIGPPGCGKTRSVFDSEPNLWSAQCGYEWYDGYVGQEAVLFDDYEGEIDFRTFLKILDRYPMQLKTKGGFTWWVPKRIYITSNLELNRWYRGRNIDALIRRIEAVVEMQ